jgi:hypothetical protein
VTITPDQRHNGGVNSYAALARSFEDQAGGDRELADRLRSEYFSELGKRSGSKRRAKAVARRAALQRQARELGLSSEYELLRLARQKC